MVRVPLKWWNVSRMNKRRRSNVWEICPPMIIDKSNEKLTKSEFWWRISDCEDERTINYSTEHWKGRKTTKSDRKVLCEMVTLMPCSYLSAPRCAGLIEKMIEIEPKVHTQFSSPLPRNKIKSQTTWQMNRQIFLWAMNSEQININVDSGLINWPAIKTLHAIGNQLETNDPRSPARFV